MVVVVAVACMGGCVCGVYTRWPLWATHVARAGVRSTSICVPTCGCGQLGTVRHFQKHKSVIGGVGHAPIGGHIYIQAYIHTETETDTVSPRYIYRDIYKHNTYTETERQRHTDPDIYIHTYSLTDRHTG